MFEKWCQTAYCDGVRELYESRKSKRKFLFWSITIISMVGLTSYFVVKVVENYIESPTVTTVSTMPFTKKKLPEILVCFNGGLNVSALKEENFSKDLIFVISGALPLGVVTLVNGTNAKIELDAYIRKNNFNMAQIYEKFAYKCSDMVEFVYQAGNSNEIGCNNVSVMLSSIYGTCLLYRDVGIQQAPGLSNGVKLRLKLPKNTFVEHFPLDSLKLDKTLSYAISIENNFVAQTERFILVPLNMKTEISLNTKYFHRLPEGITECDLSSTAHSNLCFGHCYAQAVLDSCGCAPLKYLATMKKDNLTICTPFEEYSCTTFISKSAPCEKTCRPNCEEWLFDRDISYGALNGKEPMASVWIGYRTMQYTQINESYAFTVETAIANVGGLIGLWLGCSFVTIIQGIYYLVLAIAEKSNNVRQVKPEEISFDQSEFRHTSIRTVISSI